MKKKSRHKLPRRKPNQKREHIDGRVFRRIEGVKAKRRGDIARIEQNIAQIQIERALRQQKLIDFELQLFYPYLRIVYRKGKRK